MARSIVSPPCTPPPLTLQATIGKFQIKKKVGEDDKIFGSVTAVEIVEAIQQQTGRVLDKKEFNVPEISRLGTYEVTVVSGGGSCVNLLSRGFMIVCTRSIDLESESDLRFPPPRSPSHPPTQRLHPEVTGKFNVVVAKDTSK